MLIWEVIVTLVLIALFIFWLFNYGETTFFFLFLFVIFYLIGVFPGEEENTNIPLITLERGSEVHGNFTLGFGTVDSHIVYYSYHNLGNDRFELITIPQTQIQETDKIKPVYKKIVKCERPYIFSRCSNIDNTIYVPKNTIQKSFNP